MNNENESLVGVPLKDNVKAALEDRADENGRSMGREAAKIIEKVVMKNR